MPSIRLDEFVVNPTSIRKPILSQSGSRNPGPGWGIYLLGILGLAVAYYLGAQLGISFPYIADTITLIWPPTGIAIAVLYRWGIRYWPGVFIASTAVEAGLTSFGAAVGIAIGNTLAPIVGVLLLRYTRFDPIISSQRDSCIFVCLAAIGSMLISATNGVIWLAFDGVITWNAFWNAWWVWWLGDAIGVMIFATPVITYSRELWKKYQTKWEVLGLIFTFFACFVVSVIGVGPVLGEISRKYPLMLIPAGFSLWVVVRHGVWAGAICSMILATVAVWTTADGGGPFIRPDAHTGVLMLWNYVGGVSAVTFVIAAVAAGRDQAEARLKTNEVLYRSLVEDSAAMICRLDAHGNILFANETYLTAFRVQAEDLIGKPFIEGHTREDQAHFTKAFDSLRHGGNPISLEVLAPGGRMRWHKWTLRAVGNAESSEFGFQAVGLDVTDIRRAEQDRRTMESQLFQAQKLESLGVLASGIAHDFNNILTSILGHSELAIEEVSPGTTLQENLKQISDSARRAADRVRQLQAYAGKGPLAAKLVDVNTVVRDTANLVVVTVSKRCLIQVDPTPDLPMVIADEVQLRQVITNLIINAAEAIGDSNGNIRIHTEQIDLGSDRSDANGSRTVLLPGRYVAIHVADTGSGMDEATKARIFDPFFTTKFAGRGLGLAAVHGIVRAHHGAVEVDSTLGCGTEFTVLLPIVAEGETSSETEQRDTAVVRHTPLRIPFETSRQAWDHDKPRE